EGAGGGWVGGRAWGGLGGGSGGCGAGGAAPAVIRVLRGGDSGLARLAAGTLGKLGKEAVEPLARVLGEDENPQVRRLAAAGLALIGTQASPAGKALAKAPSDDSVRGRRM